MLNRAVIQPNSAVFLGAAADIMSAAARSADPDELFLRLEEAGVMLRIDRTVTPTMAKTPTLALWELELLRTIERVVRLGHLRHVDTGRLVLADGEVRLAPDAVVVHCAASGLRQRPLVPIWGDRAITLQPVRTGFPCFGAALAGYVEATIQGDEDRNRLCPPSPYSNTPTDWNTMQVLGHRAATSFSAHPDIKSWANTTAINPGRVPTHMENMPEFLAASRRFAENVEAGIARMADFAGLT